MNRWRPSAGDGAALLFVGGAESAGPLRVEAGEGGVLEVLAQGGISSRFQCGADVIAELVAESADYILENAGADDAVWHWNLDTDSLVLSPFACALLGVPDSGEVWESHAALRHVEPHDRVELLLSAVQALTAGRTADVYLHCDSGNGRTRLRFMARPVEGARRVLEGAIRPAGRR